MTVPNTTKTLGIALAAAIGGFVVAALLHAYPKDVATRHRYCQVCAEHEETYEEAVILGGTKGYEQRGGPLRDLLGPVVGQHAHDYTEWATIFPTFGIEPEHPEVAQRIQAIGVLEGSARTISILEQAMRNDPDHARRVVQALLDPELTGQRTTAVLHALDRDAPWPERWTAADEALAAP